VTAAARTCILGAAVAAACTPKAAPSTSAADAGASDTRVVDTRVVDTRDARELATAPSAAAPRPENTRWSGAYTSAAASIYVPDAAEWSGFKWRGADAGDAIGEGTISLTIDGQTHLVTGSAAGPIGDVILTGTAEGGRLTASVRRKDPRDQGLTGTLVASPAPDHIDGTMRLSFGDAHLVREATFHLTNAKLP
jgi:hypothetical protein